MLTRCMKLSAAGAAAVALWAGMTALGQSEGVREQGELRYASALSLLTNVENESVVNVRFEGGTVKEYVEALRKVAPEANIVVMNCVDKVEMPAVQLTKVSLMTALELLDGRSSQNGQGYTELTVTHNDGDEDGQTVWVIDCQTSASDPFGGRGYRIWSIKDMIGEGSTTSINDVVSVVESALSMVSEGGTEGEAQLPQMKFHEATGLIIAKGTDAQLSVIDEVLEAMRDSAHEEGGLSGAWWRNGAAAAEEAGAAAEEAGTAATLLAQVAQASQRVVATRDAALAEAKAAQDAQVADLQETVRLLRDQIEELRRELEQARQGRNEGGGGAAATPASGGGGGDRAVQAIW